MARPTPSIVEGIDRSWLLEAARTDPVTHAYAVWDLTREWERVRFVSYRPGGRTVAYLLIWYGLPATPIVHWVGDAAHARPLAIGLPERPCVAFVPEELLDLTRAHWGRSFEVPVQILHRPRSTAVPSELGAPARLLRPEDGPALDALRERFPNPSHPAAIDLRQVVAVGTSEPGSDALTGYAIANVRLDGIWLVNRVFVAPDARGRGLGTALTAALVSIARSHGADAALYVREDNLSARRAYERVGFQPHSRRIWVDAGAGIVEPPAPEPLSARAP